MAAEDPFELAPEVMVVIVRSFNSPVHQLQNLSRVPSTGEQRPCHCPSCHVAAGFSGSLRIVGHGFYQRQLLGLPGALEGVVIYIRRFLCLACGTTISVLPDDVHPRRWYSAEAILGALVQYLLQGKAASAVRAMFSDVQDAPRWKSLERWADQLLSPLWRWVAPELGFALREPTPPPSDGRRRLQALLSLFGGVDRSPPDELARVARASVVGTAHSREQSWLMARTA